MILVVYGALYWVIYWQRQMDELERFHNCEPIFSMVPAITRGLRRRGAYPFVFHVPLSAVVLLFCGLMSLTWTGLLFYSTQQWKYSKVKTEISEAGRGE